MATSNDPRRDLEDENLRHGLLPGKKLLVRVLVNRQVATETIEMNGASGIGLSPFLANLSDKTLLYDFTEFDAPFAFARKVQSRELTVPLLLVQETATSGRHDNEHRRWTVIPPNGFKKYAEWATRNLFAGDTDVLRIEAHFFIERDSNLIYDEMEEHNEFEREVKAAATGRNMLEDTPLVQIKITDLGRPLNEWHPSFQEETTPAHPGGLVYAPTTNQFFPQRHIEDPLAHRLVCRDCGLLAVERGLVKTGRRQRAQARNAAAQAARENQTAEGTKGVQTAPEAQAAQGAHVVQTAPEAQPAEAAQAGKLGKPRETSAHPVAGSSAWGEPDMDADERLARQLQAEEHGLRSRAGMRRYKGLD
jgi:hypothetical protein